MHGKESNGQIKRQPAEWMKLFTQWGSDKGLIFRIHKKPKVSVGKTNKNLNLKMDNKLQKTFLKT